MGKTIVYSLGGSLIVPDSINIEFLRKFRELIFERVRKGERAVIVCGGGKTCRRYNEAAKELADPSNEELDWLGIAITKVNAELIKLMFADYAHEVIITEPEAEIKTDKKIIIASGHKPGNSTDKVAVMLAKNFKANQVINMTNIDMIFDSDPNKNPEAKPIEDISADEFLNLIDNEWEPGKNIPFDPIATRLAKENEKEVVVLNGNNIENLLNSLEGRAFKGTILRPN